MPLVAVLFLLAAIAAAAVSWLSATPPPATEAADTENSSAADADGDDSPVVADVDAGRGRLPDTTPESPVTPPEPDSNATPAPASPAPASPDTAAPAGVMAGPMLVQRVPPAALTAALARLAKPASPAALADVAAYANAGWPEAQTALAVHLAAGDIVGRDVKRALKLLERAAAAGDAAAQYALGQAYLTGNGVGADSAAALAWFIVAASRGHAAALTERELGLAGRPAKERSRALDMSRHLGAGVAAGWSRDPDSGVAVWLPSWFRNGSYALRVEVPAEAGYAHGLGKVVLTGSRPGDSDRNFEGRFRHGYFHGERVRGEEIHFLETDDFLVRLPANGDGAYAGAAYWLRIEFGVQIAADPCYVAINRTPDILAVVPAGFPMLRDAAAEAVMREGWRLYQELCPGRYHADLYVVPSSFERRRRPDRMALEYSPLFASASFYGKAGEPLAIGQFENLARRAHRKAEAETARERRRQAREDRRRRAARRVERAMKARRCETGRSDKANF